MAGGYNKIDDMEEVKIISYEFEDKGKHIFFDIQNFFIKKITAVFDARHIKTGARSIKRLSFFINPYQKN
jgi:hypothetical protein